ncbi:MAG: hypothetical protein RSA20_09785, partial [Oscillospiraceae bacterium]
MNKTIASRFFSATSMLIVVSIGLLGVTFMIFANKYFESDRLNILNLCVTSAVETIDSQYDKQVDTVTDKNALRDQLRLISTTTQTTVFVANAKGEVV